MDTFVKDETGCYEGLPQPPSRMPFKKVMDCLSCNELDQAYSLCLEHRFRPRLGQLLVASGRLSAGDLDSMLLVHDSEEMRNMPMGKLLVIAGMLTGEELRQYLALQKMLRLPADHHERWGQKLVENRLITAEQLSIALNDRVVKKISLQQAIVSRGWLPHDFACENLDAVHNDMPVE
jgi:hypothetical protein